MKLPRNLSGTELVKALKILGYTPTRQSGSHLRLTTTSNGEHHITIPLHSPLKIGTLSSILYDVAKHFKLTRDELISEILKN